jgi:hypothetical protein
MVEESPYEFIRSAKQKRAGSNPALFLGCSP